MNIIKKIINNAVISTLFAALVISTISLIYQWYLQPRIIMDSSYTFSKINDQVVGDIQLINLGSKVEEGMTIRIHSSVDNEADVIVLINGVPSKEHIVLRPDFTDVVVEKLYPEDEAFISFVPKDNDQTYFEAEHFGRNMKTSRYEDLDWKGEWWEVTTTQRTALIIIVSTSLLIGIFLGRTKFLKRIQKIISSIISP